MDGGMMGRDIPHDLEAEQAVIGSMLGDKAARDRIAPHLRPEYFTDQLHVDICAGIERLVARGEPVSPISLRPEIDETALKAAGGLPHLAELVTGAVCIDIDSAEQYARRLAELYRRRTIIANAEAVAALARRSSSDVAEGRLETALAELASASLTTTKSGLPLIMWDSIETAVPPDRLVKGLLGEGRLAAFYGAPKSGKTFIVSHLALCVALGWSFFGRPVLQGAVLYVAAEGADGLKNRLIGARIKHQIPDGSDVPFAIIPVAVNLGPSGEDVPKVIATAAELARRSGYPVRIIVLDTLARVMPGADENSVADMGATLARADRIVKETGATVILVHHSGKSDAAGLRGSTALPGALDTIVRVVKSDNGERCATVEAQRDGSEGDAFAFTLEPVTIAEDDEGEPIVTAVLVPKDGDAHAQPSRPRQPSGNAGVVFRALQRAVADSGEPAPGSSHIPNGATVVPSERWREYAYQMMPAATPEARRKAFKRGADHLISNGHAGAWGPYAWAV